MATQLRDGLWWFELQASNAYLVEDGVPTLVDAGTPWDPAALREGIRDTGVAVSDIERVLLTHYDLDHVGALAALTPELDATVHVGAFDGDLLRGRQSPPLTNHKGLIQRLGSLLTSQPALDLRTVDDREVVGSFTAYHTPGHTPGHVVYVSEALGIAFLGDLVRTTDEGLSPSPWLINYDSGVLRASIRALAERAPPFEVACAGHGDPLTSGGGDALATLAASL